MTEYARGAVHPAAPPGSLCTIPPQGQAFCMSLMADLGRTKQRYYESILPNLGSLLGRNLSLAFAGQHLILPTRRCPDYGLNHRPLDDFQLPQQVPQPANIVLLLAGALAGLGSPILFRSRSASTS